MSWEVRNTHGNQIQRAVTLVNNDKSAACTTDYHKADALARKTLSEATLNAKGYGLSGLAIRTYVSQAY